MGAYKGKKSIPPSLPPETEEVLRRMLDMPPQPHKAPEKKKEKKR